MPRVRKQPQFEAFNRHPNCFGTYQEHNKSLNDWRQPTKPLMLEVGAGKAEISLQFAKDNQDWQVIALDRKSDRLYKASRQLSEQLDNLAFLQTKLKDINSYINLNNQVKLLWLAFPDPYPTIKQEKHRLTHPSMFALYREFLQSGALIRFKTDYLGLFNYTKSVLDNLAWLKISDSLLDFKSESVKQPDVATQTSYEQKFRSQGSSIYYLEATVL